MTDNNSLTSRLCVSEVMTIVIGFQGSGYRNFQEISLKEVLQHWLGEFPNLVSYNRFVELLMPWSLMLLIKLFETSSGKGDGNCLY